MLDIKLINPYIRVARRSVLKAGREIKRRVILDYELIYIEKGGFILEYSGKDYSVKSGDFIFIRPKISHAFKGINSDLSQPHIHFDMIYDDNSNQRFISFKDEDNLSDNEKSLIHKDLFDKQKTDPFVAFLSTGDILKQFFQIIDTDDKNSLTSKSAMLNIINGIISHNHADGVSTLSDSEYTVAQQIKDYIDAGQGLDADLTEYESLFSYSKFYIEKQFKSSFGASVIAYRNSKRMELAKKLLKETSVLSVSEKLGFGSIYSFSRAFKNYYGVPPSEYKNSSRK